jgi:hypothetical protein
VRDGDESRSLAERALECGQIERAVLEDRCDAQPRPALFAQHLPRYDVGVVLHLGDEHLVARAQVRSAPAGGDQVDRLGGVADEHDLARLASAQEARDALACGFVALRRERRELVHAAMDVRVRVARELRHRVDHRARLLGARARVEIGEALPVRGALEHGEVAANLRDVERGRVAARQSAHDCAPPETRRANSWLSGSRSVSGSAFRISAANPCVSSARASRSPIARERR